MSQIYAVLLLCAASATAACSTTLQPGGTQLFCHRTANQDVPENTMDSLQQAVLLGCNLVEIDIRRTLDGELVLNHDGVLERLTDGVGEIETTYYGDMQRMDAGAWMGERFQGMSIARFDDALRFARDHDIRLYLDMKDAGMGPAVLQMLQREGMLQRVQFGGKWDDVKLLYPAANASDAMTVWVEPGVTAEQVKTFHRAGKAVVVNFSTNGHDMDLAGMKAAVASGADAINVDYPRLGADAVGRPVERKLNALAVQASAGESNARSQAILEMSRYRGFDLQGEFAHWLLDPDDAVSRAAALALVTARPPTPASVFNAAMQSADADARANAAWALGALRAPANTMLPLLQDKNPQVLQAALIALAHMPGKVSADALLPLLTHDNHAVRGAAALALAKHQPDAALAELPKRLQQERKDAGVVWADYLQRGRPKLSPEEARHITSFYRSQMDMVQALAMLHGPAATEALEQQAFLLDNNDFTSEDAVVSAFQLWDRIGADAAPAVQALRATDAATADRAEWVLVQGGSAVLPEVRKALNNANPDVRKRAIEIVAWQGDMESIETLRTMQKTDPANAALASWALEKIETLHPKI